MSNPHEPGSAGGSFSDPLTPTGTFWTPPGMEFEPGPRYPGGSGASVGSVPENRAGTVALVLGIIAVATFWIPLLYLVGSVPCGVVAVFEGSQGRSLAATGRATNGGSATAGFVCGIVALVLCALNLLVGLWIARGYADL